jgi:hypothetical protein
MNEIKSKFGEKITPILIEIENAIWEHDFANIGKPNYSIEAFRASIKIFMSILMDKMWELQCNEKLNIEDKSNMAQKAGEELRKLVKTYTNIDTHSLYENNN